MTNEISSDVEYLINQLNEIKNNKNQLEINYENEKINGQNRLTKEETQKQPTIEINNEFEDNKYLTLVCYIDLFILIFFFYIFI